MRWNDASKMKSVRFAIIVSTIHTFEMVDSKIDRSIWCSHSKARCYYGLQCHDVIVRNNAKYNGIEKLMNCILDISVYYSFIMWKKMNPDKQNVDHLSY